MSSPSLHSRRSRLSDVLQRCGTCEGTGVRPGYEQEGESCRVCGGAGYRLIADAATIARLLEAETQ